MKLDVDYIIGVHNPKPLRFDFGNKFKPHYIGKYISVEISSFKTAKIVKLQHVIRSKVMHIDISGVLKSNFDNKEPYNLAALYVSQDDYDIPVEINIEINFKDEVFEIGHRVEKRIFCLNGTYSREQMHDTEFFRLAPNGRQTNLTHFIGYPQADVYLVKDGDVELAPETHTPQYVTKERNDTQPLYGKTTATPYSFVQREVDECGVFVRWLNTHGGWSYWLFSEEYTEEIKTKSLGVVQRFAKTTDDFLSRNYHLGFSAKKTWQLDSKVPALANEIEEIKTLFVSPEVYVFKGERGDFFITQLATEQWERVAVADGSTKFDMNDHATFNVSVTLEFDEIPTIKQV